MLQLQSLEDWQRAKLYRSTLQVDRNGRLGYVTRLHLYFQRR